MVIVAFILALASSIAAIVLSILVYRMHRNIKGHVKHLKNAFDSFKKLMDGKIEAVDKKIDDHIKEHEAWQRSVLEEFGKKFAAQDLKNEQAVQRVADAVSAIAKSRGTIAGAFRDAVRLLHSELKKDDTLLQGASGPVPSLADKAKPHEDAPLFNQPGESQDKKEQAGAGTP
jgi:hypothetical protein